MTTLEKQEHLNISIPTVKHSPEIMGDQLKLTPVPFTH